MDSLIGPLPDGWTAGTLGEICDILAGPSTKQVSSTRSELADVPVVLPRNLRNNRIIQDIDRFVSHAEAARLSRYRLVPADIVCVRTGQLGRQALVTPDQAGWLPGSGCLRLRVRPMINARYLVHYLDHPAVHEWIDRNARSSVIPTLTTKTLSALPVVIPEPDRQAEIADVLGALDDKIAVHEEISSTTSTLRAAVLLRLLTDGVD